jgi:hypothetical protein
MYEIHFINEAAGNGSIQSLQSDMLTYDKFDIGNSDLHLPLAYVADLFKFHYMPGWKVGYRVNHPGDLNGKIANYVSFIIALYYSLLCQS